jgi:hypothetical protein
MSSVPGTTSDSYVEMPPDSTGKMTRMQQRTVQSTGNVVYEQVVNLTDGTGIIIDPRQTTPQPLADYGVNGWVQNTSLNASYGQSGW